VTGSYVPRLITPDRLPDNAGGENKFPAVVLEGEGVSIEYIRYSAPTGFATRNVFADEVHFVVAGGGRLETDFGWMDVEAGDVVLLPRAVTYRFASVDDGLETVIMVTESEMTVSPSQPIGVLNMDLHVDSPAPWEGGVSADEGEYKVVIRHGEGRTTYYYDFDPIPCIALGGAPIIRRFNMRNVYGPGLVEGGLVPARLMDDASTKTLVFDISARRSDRPPIHHHADYDEIYLYFGGEYGPIKQPGTIMWTPKGIVHHALDEDVPEGYKTLLIELRAPLNITDVGAAASDLMCTSRFVALEGGTESS
jgi:homogentisate 1,2-dioxygenase